MSESHSDEDPVVMSVSRSALVESSVTKESQSDELGDSIDCVDLDSRAPCVQAASSDDTSPPTERSPPTIAIRACWKLVKTSGASSKTLAGWSSRAARVVLAIAVIPGRL